MSRAAALSLVVTLVLGAAMAAAATGMDISATEAQSFSGSVVSGLGCSITSATIDWGDGTSSTGTGDGAGGVRGDHTYSEEGSYSGSVSYTYINDPRLCPTGTQTSPFHAAVADAALSSTGLDISGTAGQPLDAVVAHLTDANPAAGTADFSVLINWGDGTTSAGAVTSDTSLGFDVTGTHTYSTAGSFPLSTSITDAGGSTTATTSTAHIGSAPAPPAPPAPPPVVPATIILSGPVGVTSDLQQRFDFTSTIAGSTFQCALDPGLRGTTWLPCATPHLTATLAPGVHRFKVRAVSPAGVTDPTGAQRVFTVQPAASTERQVCVRASWENVSLGAGVLFGFTGEMVCNMTFSCPQWYDCVLSGNFSVSFELPGASGAGTDEVGAGVDAFADEAHAQFTSDDECEPYVGPDKSVPGLYQQSGDWFYCSKAAQVSLHGQSPADAAVYGSPRILCSAETSLRLAEFTGQLLGCDASINRTWAPGVPHARPLIDLNRIARIIPITARPAINTGAVAACPTKGGACEANVSVVVASAARAGAARATLQVRPRLSTPPIVGARTLKIRAGTRANVTFTLTRTGRTLLRKRHRVRVTITITRPPARLRGRDSVIRRTLTLVSGH